MEKNDQDSANQQKKIKEVVFLTPAKITIVENDQEKTVMTSVDIINRKVYLADGDDSLSDLVFSHLDNVNSLPEDFFMAPDEVREEAAKAEADRERIYKENIGVENE